MSDVEGPEEALTELVRSQIEEREGAMQEAMQGYLDLVTYGVSYSLDGQRVDPRDVRPHG